MMWCPTPSKRQKGLIVALENRGAICDRPQLSGARVHEEDRDIETRRAKQFTGMNRCRTVKIIQPAHLPREIGLRQNPAAS